MSEQDEIYKRKVAAFKSRIITTKLLIELHGSNYGNNFPLWLDAEKIKARIFLKTLK